MNREQKRKLAKEKRLERKKKEKEVKNIEMIPVKKEHSLK